MNKILERISWVQKNSTILSGTMEQATTPLDVIEDMYNEVPQELVLSCPIVDPYCGRGPILLEGIKRKFEAVMTGKEEHDNSQLANIVSTQIFGNDIDPEYHLATQSSLKRVVLNPNIKLNIDNTDGLLYNTNMANTISVTNPPYQPPRGIKKGGNEYKKHVRRSVSNYPKYGVANIPMTFMVQDPFDKANIDFRNFLIDSGLKKIRHVRPDAYTANVLTVYIVWEDGYTGDVEFVTYDIDDVNIEHTVVIDRKKLRTMGVWPVVRNDTELALVLDVMSYAKKSYKFFKSDPSTKSSWCVDWEYLIGMEKERLNRKINIRGLKMCGPNDIPRGGSLTRFYNCADQTEAQSLHDFLADTGQKFMQTIPRGSSVENWMMGPLIEMWRVVHSQTVSNHLFETV